LPFKIEVSGLSALLGLVAYRTIETTQWGLDVIGKKCGELNEIINNNNNGIAKKA
jgi:hypothetical protein